MANFVFVPEKMGLINDLIHLPASHLWKPTIAAIIMDSDKCLMDIVI